MIYSRSVEHAIRALVFLSQVPEGQYVMVKHIAQQEDIPSHFLAKILQDLARKGFLRSSKGPTGGFVLRRKPEDIFLIDIVKALDGLAAYEKCVGGLAECNDQMPCGMHDSWKALRSRIMGYLERTSIAGVSIALEEKRRVLKKAERRRAAAKNK
jgi:Rrf2 family iron-sulfur cluster assembly transcriptional regulator